MELEVEGKRGFFVDKHMAEFERLVKVSPVVLLLHWLKSLSELTHGTPKLGSQFRWMLRDQPLPLRSGHEGVVITVSVALIWYTPHTSFTKPRRGFHNSQI